MKFNEDVFDMAWSAKKYFNKNDILRVSPNAKIAQIYKTGLRVYLQDWKISDRQQDSLRLLELFEIGRREWLSEKDRRFSIQSKLQEISFLYGLQEGLRLAKKCIDTDLVEKKDKMEISEKETAGYRKAKAAISKYDYIDDLLIPRKNRKRSQE